MELGYGRLSDDKTGGEVNTTNGMCECGCNNLAPIAKRTNKNRGWVKGQPLRFIKGHSVGTFKGPNKAIHFDDGVTILALERKDGSVLPCYLSTSKYELIKGYHWHS